jgi:hypothetical protein
MHRRRRVMLKRLSSKGGTRVYLAYPYARGHLRVRDGAGCERFFVV